MLIVRFSEALVNLNSEHFINSHLDIIQDIEYHPFDWNNGIKSEPKLQYRCMNFSSF